MSRYYVADGMVQRGPFELLDLPGQGLRPDVLVWKEGMDQWRRADQVQELVFAGVLGPATVPLPPVSTPAHYGADAAGYQPIYSSPSYNSVGGNRVAAGVCGILLGSSGVHKFILGMPVAGTVMLLLNLVGGLLTCGLASAVVHLIGLIEGILYLTKTDAQFHQDYVVERRSWF